MTKATRREFAMQCSGAAAAVALGQLLDAREVRAGTSRFRLSVDIMGLNAIVLDRNAARAEVLFVNPQGMGNPRHTPFLVASISDVINPPEDSRPTTVTVVPAVSGAGVQQLGLWDLTDTQVIARAAGGVELVGGVRVNAGTDERPAGMPADPDDPEAWRDFRYVADMERICGEGRIMRGASSLDAPSPDAGVTDPPGVVAGRIRLSAGLLEGAIPSWEEHRRVQYSFSAGKGGRTVSQPLTDTIRWSIDHDAAAGGNYLALDLVPLRGDISRSSRTLMLAQRGRACRLAISNLPVENGAAGAHHAGSEADMAALHFGAYYELLRHAPDARPMPRRLAPNERRSTGGWMGPICPPARFTAR